MAYILYQIYYVQGHVYEKKLNGIHMKPLTAYLFCLPTESTNHTLVDEQAIFANNELGMRHIDVYGFDYDYTLASYSNELHFLIYDLAVKELIATYGVRNKTKS